MSLQTQATVYKWIDNKGVTQYTQTPPLNRDSSIISRPPPSNLSQQQVQAIRLKIQEDIAIAQQQALEDKQKKQAAMTQREVRKQQCQQVRIDLAMLNNKERQRYRTAEGEVIRLSATQRKLLQQQLNNKITLNCPPS